MSAWCTGGSAAAQHGAPCIMRDRLSNAQHKFLREIEQEWADEKSARRRLASLPPLVLARWMESAPFRRRLTKTLYAVRQCREVAMSMASVRAAERICAAMEAGTSLSGAELRACLELVRQERERERNPLRRPPTDEEVRRRGW